MYLNAKTLESCGACDRHFQKFMRAYPGGTDLTFEILLEGYERYNLDSLWIVILLSNEKQNQFVSWCLSRVEGITNSMTEKTLSVYNDEFGVTKDAAHKIAQHCRFALAQKHQKDKKKNRRAIIRAEYIAQLEYLATLL
jgi:hypothetical protein